MGRMAILDRFEHEHEHEHEHDHEYEYAFFRRGESFT